jgi:transposase
MTMPCDDAMPKGGPVRRFEVFTGSGPRRRWSDEDKARILAESYSGKGTVCEVARRHGLAPTQLFTWRRDARQRLDEQKIPAFTPVMIEPVALPMPSAGRPEAKPKTPRRSSPGQIELEIDGVVVRVGRGAQAKTVAAVIQALKAAR